MRESVSPSGLSLDPVHGALGLAALRAVWGAGLMIAPSRFGGGSSAGRQARMRGGRDLALALHQVWALDRPADLPRTHRLHSLVAAGDGVSSLAGRSGPVPLMMAVLESAGHVFMAKRWDRDPQVAAARA